MKKDLAKLVLFVTLILPVTVFAADQSFKSIAMPHGKQGIGFDDLCFAPKNGKVLVPGGQTGGIFLIDPQTHEIKIVGELKSNRYSGGHGEGVTSADEGDGFIFTIDRTAMTVNVIDPLQKTIISSAQLSGHPDYVRYVDKTKELWVTEPREERIEVFTFTKTDPMLSSTFSIPVPAGPESLVIDNAHQRAYTHLWKGKTMAIDLTTHHVIDSWPNGCEGSRGIALDEDKGFLFAGCNEGKAIVMDISNKGKILDTLKVGSGVDVISYNKKLRHLYLPASESATLSIAGVSGEGKFTLLKEEKVASGSHCVASDNLDQIWVCDPDQGQLLLFTDSSSLK